MAVPTSYTEETLAQYMHSELGPVADILGYQNPAGDAGIYQEAVNESLINLGISDIASVTNIRKLRAVARLQAWDMALNALSSMYDFSADGSTYNRSQMRAMAQRAVDKAMSDCYSLGLSGYEVSIEQLRYSNDPYGFPTELED